MHLPTLCSVRRSWLKDFTSVLEAPALNMGVFVGIIAGFVGAMAYNKYYNYRKLPDALSFSMESALFRLLLSYGQQSWH